MNLSLTALDWLIFAIVIGLIDLGFKNALAWFYKEF